MIDPYQAVQSNVVCFDFALAFVVYLFCVTSPSSRDLPLST